MCVRKIGISDRILVIMERWDRQWTQSRRGPRPLARNHASHTGKSHFARRRGRRRIYFGGQGSAQPFEKARFGQGNARESKGFFVALRRHSAHLAAFSGGFRDSNVASA